jgi:hypothetical protein
MKTVITSTTGIVSKTTIAGLSPSEIQTRNVTAAVATVSLNNKELTLSLAVSP